MVTNQIMTRKMEIGGYKFFQRTSDGFFNATSLIDSWNLSNPERSIKRICDYLENSSTVEYIDEINRREDNLLNGEKSIKSKNQIVIHSKTQIKGIKGRPKDNVYMHPMLFIDFAMWIDPKFKYDVIKFVQDKMLDYRNDSSDEYRRLSNAIASISAKEDVAKNISKIAEAINWVVFNNHYPGIRNDHGSEKEMRELYMLEHDLSNAILWGKYKTIDSIIDDMRKDWEKKHANISNKE